MKHILAPALIAGSVACSLMAFPLVAQTNEPQDSEPQDRQPQDRQDGSSLMERGAELFWKGLREEMAPSLQELEGLMSQIGPSMQSFLAEMGPALAEIADKVEDWSRYEAPEILPNGDIIIRRKPDEPEVETPEGGASEGAGDGSTDL
ncbi:hypothetical protein ACFP4H_12525 [Pseudophaeobacter arcticus]|uniref:hypothetical protein n=1 Tax=Pseudophaeobacter arcticus TaxID=385492 RepID=UPI0003FFB5B2|nr:hypothetical protein [Pseudophaeobacter arcticus]